MEKMSKEMHNKFNNPSHEQLITIFEDTQK